MTNWTTRLTDLIAPRTCLVCGRRLSVGEAWLCTICNLRLPRTNHQQEAYDNEMARMFWGRVPIERCGALFFYKSGSDVSQLIYNIKYGDRPDVAKVLGQMAAKEFQDSGFFEDINLIVPTPLSWHRRVQRGYNQSTLIAEGVHRITGIPVERHAVRRLHFQDSQTHRFRWERNDNVEGAFQLVRPQRLAGRHVLLVDDIATSGATLCACATEMMHAPNLKISILTLGFTKG